MAKNIGSERIVHQVDATSLLADTNSAELDDDSSDPNESTYFDLLLENGSGDKARQKVGVGVEREVVNSGIIPLNLDELPHHHGGSAEVTAKELQEKYVHAETVVLLCGVSGLGDALSQARGALFFAREGKKVICQVPRSLIPILRQDSNITWVEKIETSLLDHQDTFFVSLDPYQLLSNPDIVEKWTTIPWPEDKSKNQHVLIDGQYQDYWNVASDLGNRVRNLQESASFCDHDAVLGQSSIYDWWKSIDNPDKKNWHRHNTYYAWRLWEITGKRVSLDDFDGELLPVTKDELESVPQVTDLVVFPDAKEGEVPGKERSLKSLDIEKTWKPLLSKMLVPTCLTEFISGDWQQMRKVILGSCSVLTMDSVTAYVAHYLSLAARKQGREIHVLEIFNGQAFPLQDYVIPDLPTLVFTNQFFDEQSVTIGDFSILRNDVYPLLYDLDPNVVADRLKRDSTKFPFSSIKIVRGLAHPEYCEDVYKAALDAHQK